jgi:hypothetical protein
MSRRARLSWYGSAGASIVLGILVSLALGGEVGNIAGAALTALGLVLASIAIFLDLTGGGAQGGDAAEEVHIPPTQRERWEAARRRAERSLALERERERQRRAHDALARPAKDASGLGSHRRSPKRRPRRPE